MHATHGMMTAIAASTLSWLMVARAQAQAEVPPEPAAYGAHARVSETSSQPTQPTEAESSALSQDMGVSFSLAESLPGVVPVFSGVPYLIVRGSTPSGTLTYYDGVSIPALFHIALGPSVVNPRMIGKLSFHAGPAPARYGSHIGGALIADASRQLGQTGAEARGPTRELELTLLDASGYLHVPEANTTFAWRIGDPGLLMNVLGLDATLNYYDYQLRHEAAIGDQTRLLLLALGAGDNLGDRTSPEDDIGLDFHRLLARVSHRAGDFDLGSQVVVGYDSSLLGQELSGESFRITPELFAERRIGTARMRAGASMNATHVTVRRSRADQARQSLFERSEGLTLNPEDFLDGQPFASAPTRNGFGVYTELEFEPAPRLTLQLGLRGDLWLASNDVELSASPMARIAYALTPTLSLSAAAALGHQPHGSPIPLPSLYGVAMDRGLEHALQSELGLAWQLGSGVQLESTVFYHRYFDTVYLELILDCEGNTNTEAARAILLGQDLASICRQPGLPTADGETYGWELFVKRELTERVAGFISYTLGFADATARDGTDFTPQSDVRHVANAVLRFDLGHGFALGVRGHYRSGKVAVNTVFDAPRARFDRIEHRLPGFFRADLRGSYSWDVSFGRLEASLGVQNITASAEATNRDCVIDQNGDWTGEQLPILCSIDYQPAIILPNVGLRAEM